jgi:hypothetical protein
MKSVILTKDSNYAPVEIRSWNEFKEQSASLCRMSIINGLKFFFLHGHCDAEAVFDFIRPDEHVDTLWREMHYGGDMYEAYFADSLRKDFRTKYPNDDSMLELNSFFLKPYNRNITE